jgi:opacity protein-like surface antigen
MKKTILLIVIVVLLAGSASAQTSAAGSQFLELPTPFEAEVGIGYRWVSQDGNPRAGQYEWLHSSPAGKAIIEWDPLPHRFLFETFIQNEKDYWTEMNYAYRDLLMFNVLSRSLYHNLDHYSLGQDDPATPSPSTVDFNPFDKYGMQDAMLTGLVRFKTPDFPFHVYLEAKSWEKHGTVQQRFLRSFSGGYNKASQSRKRDLETTEAKGTINSHVGPVEVEYSHTQKKFKDTQDKVLYDTTTVTYDHNLIPNLESSVDTIKVHTSHTGRISASATYSSGDKKNTDSSTRADFTNAAADFTWIPTKDVTASVKYRHHEVDEDTPAAVSDALVSPTPLPVRQAISSKKDALSGMVRYRATQKLIVRAEYLMDKLSRDNATAWGLDQDITKNTVRLGFTYRVTNRIQFRGDATYQTADVPANSIDPTYPDKTESARGWLTWVPASWFNAQLSAGMVHEERSNLGAPFAGERKADRSRVLGSVMFLPGKKTAVTPSYAFYQNKQTGPIAYQDLAGAITSEGGVPYADTAHVASLTVSHAVTDVVLVTAEAAKSWSRGSWQNAGVVPGSSGIADYSNLKLDETVLGADVQLRYTKNVGTDFRYQYRNIDDILDNTQDGTNQVLIATLTYRW